MDVFKLFAISFSLLSCDIMDAREFYCDHINIFENSWWEYNFEGSDQCFNVYDGNNTIWLYDIENEEAWLWQEWSFTPPNTYHLKDYDIEVFPDGDCYELEVLEGLMSDTVCECPVEPEWREPYSSSLQSFDHSESNSF
jgi:hypothetical protein